MVEKSSRKQQYDALSMAWYNNYLPGWEEFTEAKGGSLDLEELSLLNSDLSRYRMDFAHEGIPFHFVASASRSMLDGNLRRDFKVFAHFPFHLGVEFEVRPSAWLHEFLTMLSLKRVETGIPKFDRTFHVSGRPAHKVRELFLPESIREPMHFHELNLRFRRSSLIKDLSLPRDGFLLLYEAPDIIGDTEQLSILHNWFCALLNHVSQLGWSGSEREVS